MIFKCSLLAIATLTTFAGIAHADPVETPATFTTVYVPRGFDSNDNAQFVAEGVFKDACFRPAPTSVQVDQNTKKITVGPLAYKYDGICAQVILPFDRTIDLGVLKPGNYQIVQAADSVILGNLPVTQATRREPDDFLYAPIAQAYLHENKDASATVMVSGDFPNSCMHMKELKVTVQQQAKSIVVQPIATMDKTNCQMISTPFEQSVKVDNPPKGRYLLHVRSMNGKAINDLVNIY